MSSIVSFASDDRGPCQPVIVLQTTNAAVIALAQRMNASTCTTFEKWSQMARTHAAWAQVVNALHANPDRNPEQLASATQVLNAAVFIRRYHEDNGPEVFPTIQVVDKLIFISL